MNNNYFRHVNVSPDLVIEFITTFSRLEYALKSAGFAIGGNNRVDPDWDSFANSIHPHFIQIVDDTLKECVNYLFHYPPRKQVLIDGRLEFVDQTIDPNQKSTQQLLKMIRTIRNNLFHGGKYCPNGEIEQGRNQRLLHSALIILKCCYPLHIQVSESYER